LWNRDYLRKKMIRLNQRQADGVARISDFLATASIITIVAYFSGKVSIMSAREIMFLMASSVSSIVFAIRLRKD